MVFGASLIGVLDDVSLVMENGSNCVFNLPKTLYLQNTHILYSTRRYKKQ